MYFKDYISFDLNILSRQLIPQNVQHSIQFVFKEDRFLLLVLLQFGQIFFGNFTIFSKNYF